MRLEWLLWINTQKYNQIEMVGIRIFEEDAKLK